MPNRSRKVPYGIPRTVHVPRTRRRDAQPIILVVPERPTLAQRAARALGTWLWETRRSWAPTGIAVAALLTTAVLHGLFWWTAFLLATATFAPYGWLVWLTWRRPADDRSIHHWRKALAALATLAIAWAALAVFFGPLAGPLGLIWLALAITAQALWLRTRRAAASAPVEEIR
ncbi:hypothetical protein [Streptomyces cylindrosporus]|uniref:Integral membrane protein n=1 Tax=Streptomyces cylindrosporus TaxID=2927583 RepID=A0ABS9YK90_9ACTN|nr:hypothetical protein [Streptomyces cylindrosporus]MCI3276256.1 hypothetical protein [Streptomyces cylindrosporus]